MPARERLAHRRGGRERHARGLPLLEAQADVLEHVLELEQRGVVVLAHRARLQGRACAEPPLPAPMTCASASRSTPVARPTTQRLGERVGVGRGDRVVDELDHLALADLVADVHDQLAHGLEQRAGAREVRRRRRRP